MHMWQSKPTESIARSRRLVGDSLERPFHGGPIMRRTPRAFGRPMCFFVALLALGALPAAASAKPRTAVTPLLVQAPRTAELGKSFAITVSAPTARDIAAFQAVVNVDP